MKFPDFIIIGAAKCGTTALWMNLDKHPEIDMGRKTYNSIEMHFWGYKFWKKGFDWYKNKFKGKLSGEKSVDYWISRKSMRLIKQHIPNTKLILCVRNPIDRAYSNFQMHMRAGKVSHFSMNLFKRQYARKGKYYSHIKDIVLHFFPKEQLYVCVAERMKIDTSNEMDKIFKFLGAKDYHLPTKIVPGDRTKRAKSLGLDIDNNRTEKFYRVWTKGQLKLQGPMRKEVLKYYRPHNKKLFEFLGYEIEEWKC
jgi:hypothetical protein